ncbi:MAG: hypothetical protein R2857_14045 [Vampirovibrionales bacterium]
MGLKAQFNWLDGQTIPATQLILTELLPLAYKGLEKLGVDEADRRHYLGIIEARTRTGLTGAQWLLGSLDELNQANSATPDQKSRTLVKAMIARQQTGKPVHEWTFAEPCGPSASAPQLPDRRAVHENQVVYSTARRPDRPGHEHDGLETHQPHPGRRRRRPTTRDCDPHRSAAP